MLLIDDLHWIDPGSDLFVAQIVEAVSATRTLLLVNFRPEYQADWTRKSWVLQLPMAPLGADALAELVRDWVGSGRSVAELPALIGARSGGNPFFAEEIVLLAARHGTSGGERGSLRAPRGYRYRSRFPRRCSRCSRRASTASAIAKSRCCTRPL